MQSDQEPSIQMEQHEIRQELISAHPQSSVDQAILPAVPEDVRQLFEIPSCSLSVYLLYSPHQSVRLVDPRH